MYLASSCAKNWKCCFFAQMLQKTNNCCFESRKTDKRMEIGSVVDLGSVFMYWISHNNKNSWFSNIFLFLWKNFPLKILWKTKFFLLRCSFSSKNIITIWFLHSMYKNIWSFQKLHFGLIIGILAVFSCIYKPKCSFFWKFSKYNCKIPGQ